MKIYAANSPAGKYTFTGNTQTIKDGYGKAKKLFQIVALRDVVTSDGIVVARKGDLGGYIASERCLSHEGGCWVADGNFVCGGRVTGDAQIKNVDYNDDNFEEIMSNIQMSNSVPCDPGPETYMYSGKLMGNATVMGSCISGATIGGNAVIAYSEITPIGMQAIKTKIAGHALVVNSIVDGDNVSIKGRTMVIKTIVSDSATIDKNAIVGPFSDDSVEVFVSRVGSKPNSTHINVITHNARITDHAIIDSAKVGDNAVVGGHATIYMDAYVGGNTIVDEHAQVSYDACVCGDAHIGGNSDITGEP